MAEKARRYRDIDRATARLNRICLYKLLHGEKIHPGQPPILKFLLEKDGRSQCELANLIGVSRASLGVSLRRMENAGVITRRSDARDTRYNMVYLTEVGRELALKSEAALDTLTAWKLDGFSEQELDQLLSYLSRIQANLLKMQESSCDEKK